ncbi:MAG: T9SS type A sorting domain-containing protein [Paludibacteraceae bacterium]|nr:T9SS type A sorting domain-containing protein [Paludibacteraceae bacterium]
MGLSDSQYQNYKITNTVTHDFVKIQVFDNECYTLTVLDLNGKVISNTKIIENETIIDMRLFQQGIYVFKLIDSAGMISSQKIVKQ